MMKMIRNKMSNEGPRPPSATTRDSVDWCWVGAVGHVQNKQGPDRVDDDRPHTDDKQGVVAPTG